MNTSDILTIARKDLWVAMHRRTTRLSLLLFPLVMAIGLSLVLGRIVAQPGVPTAALLRLRSSFLFFFVIIGGVLPTSIAAYSLVGEKVERSLEPLLATPARELDILLGKSLAALIPTAVSTWLGIALFSVLADRQTAGLPGVTPLPDSMLWLISLLVIPLAALLCVLVCVLISARATDVRSAQQGASLILLPFGAIYVTSEVGVITLDPTMLLWLALALVAVDVALFVLARTMFDREEILTRWR